MQSGTSNMKQWRIDLISDDKKFVDPTMGWIGGRDTTRQLNLHFDSKDDAIEYCNNNALTYEIDELNNREVKAKSYADNFATAKRTYSDVVATNKIDL